MEKKSGKFLVLLAGLIGVVLGLSSCEKKQPEAYKIGAAFALTGALSSLGVPEKKTTEMIVEQINKRGGVNGHPLELIVMDTEGKASKATLAIKKMMSKDNVLAVIGPSSSGVSMAVVPLAEEHQTPLISCAASFKIVHNSKTGKPFKWVFKTPQTDSMAIASIFTYLKTKGINRIAVISSIDGFGSSGLFELKRLAPQYGMRIVGNEKCYRNDNDVKTQLARIRSQNPQAIVNWSIGPVLIAITRNWKELGMDDILLFQNHGFGSLTNIEKAEGAAEGVYVPLGAMNIAEILPDDHPQKEVTMRYLNNYTAKYRQSPSSFGGHAWDALHMLILSLENSGSNRARIRDELENITGFVGQHGIFNMSANDHIGLNKTAFVMLVVRNNTWAFAD